MNNESTKQSKRFRAGNAFKLAAWTFGFLVLGDVAVNILFSYPQDNHVEPSTLQRYFDYGRSTEAKLRRMIPPKAETEAYLATVGWLHEPEPSYTNVPESLDITVYGSSFALRLSEAMEDAAPDMNIRIIGAPSAPVSWTYATFLEDTRINNPDVAVLTILSRGLGKLAAMTGATANFDLPYPYTQPHFLESETQTTVKPKAIYPVILSLADMRSALYQREPLWREYVAQLRQYDPYFHDWLFTASWMDYSALLRLARRGFWIWHRRKVEQGLYSSAGFNPKHPVSQTTITLMRAFVTDARKQGILPVVYLVNNYGTGQHLYDLLADTLDELDAAYVSSHVDISPTDPRAFLPDSHFRPDLDLLMAGRVLDKIQKKE